MAAPSHRVLTIESQSHSSRPALPLTIVLYAAMATLLIYSLIFWKERVCFSDTPGYLVNMTAGSGFEPAHNRYVVVLNQWLPVLFIKSGASLKAVAIAYSFGYSLAPVLMALLALHWLRQPYTALAIMLLVTLMNSLLFYYTVSELQSGLVLLLLYDGIWEHTMQTQRRRWPAFILSSLLILPTVAFAHPMCALVFGGWIGYRLLVRPRSWRAFAVAVGTFGVAWFVKREYFTSFYEAEKNPTLDSLFPIRWNVFNGTLAETFLAYLTNDAFLTPVLLVVAILFCIVQRKFLQLVWMTSMALGLTLLLLLKFEHFSNEIYDQYYEHYLHAALFFPILIFCRRFGQLRWSPSIKATLLVAVFAISFAKIATAAIPHKHRRAWMAGYLRLMDSLGVKKATIDRGWAPPGAMLSSFWNAPNESLIQSAIEGGPGSAKTLFMVWGIPNIPPAYTSMNTFLLDGWQRPQREVMSRYIQLDSTQRYVILEYLVPDSVLNSLRYPPGYR